MRHTWRPESIRRCCRLVSLLLALAICCDARPCQSQDQPLPEDVLPQLFEDDDDESDFLLGGPAGVDQQLEYWESRPALFEVYRFPELCRFRKRLEDEWGLDFGFNGYLLYQQSDRRIQVDERQAFGGIYRLQGSWTAFRDTSHVGRLECRLEGRDALSSLPAPSVFSGNAGIRTLNTGFVYTANFDSSLAICRWAQTFHDGRVAVSLGIHAFDVHQDPTPFQTIGRAFLNRAMVVSPAIGTTAIGAMALVTKCELTDRLWIGYQMYDANAQNGKPFWETMSSDEWLKNVELGWTPDPDRYLTDRVVVTLWHRDRLEDRDSRSGWGGVLSASRQVSDPLLLFLRLGHNDGGGDVLARNYVAGGFEYAFNPFEALSLGLAWGDPASRLRNEYLIETSYRVQVTPHISVLPNLQCVIHPAASKNSAILLASLRTIISI